MTFLPGTTEASSEASTRAGRITAPATDRRDGSGLVVRLFGGVEFCGPTGRTTLSGVKQRALAGRLAFSTGAAVSVDQLLDAVWGEQLPPTVRSSLQVHVSQIRRALTGVGLREVLLTTPAGYLLDVPADAVDVHRFEQLAAQATGAHDQGDDERALNLAHVGLGLWRGPPLSDIATVPYVAAVAARLEGQLLALVAVAADASIPTRRMSEVLPLVESLATEHPYAESLWESLARLLYAHDRQVDALDRLATVRHVLREDLGLDPSPSLVALESAILVHDPSLARATPFHERSAFDDTLPSPPTSFVEPTRFNGLIAAVNGGRMMTLTGPAGCGKTRLALELAARSGPRFADGVFLIELAPIVERDAVVATVASALSVIARPGRSLLESIADRCRGRQLLLVVDNCEHVLDAAGGVLSAILQAAPTTGIIATSRENLGISGEWVHKVPLLDRADAVGLFADRARAADSSYILDDADRHVVGRLCDRLDGLPLAIELAAAQVRWMTPAELLGHLEDRFRLLRVNARHRADRHRTLGSAVTWSYEMLTDAERVVFERASAFRGSFDLDAAQAVCAGSGVDREEIPHLVATLVDKSMVVAHRQSTGTRYRLLETLREYGAEKLEHRIDCSATRDEHLRHFLELLDHTDRLFRGRSEVSALHTYENEWDNVRAAHDWSVRSNDLDRAEQILDRTWLYSSSRNRSECGAWVERTLAIEGHGRPSPHTYGQAAWWAQRDELFELSDFHVLQGIERAPTPHHATTALCWLLASSDVFGRAQFRSIRPLDHLETVMGQLDLDHDWWALVELIHHAWDLPAEERLDWETPDRPRLVAQLAEIAHRVGAPSLQAIATLSQALVLVEGGPADADRAADWCARALQFARDARNVDVEAQCLRAAALAATQRVPDERAALACHDALDYLHSIADWENLRKTLCSAALVLATFEHWESAAMALGRQEHLADLTDVLEIGCGFRVRALALLHGLDRAEEWLQRGTTTDRDEVVARTIKELKVVANCE